MAGIEQTIATALREAGALTTSEIHNLFRRNVPQLGDVLMDMEARGEVASIKVATKGRPCILWELAEASAPVGQMMAVDTAEAEPLIPGRELGPVEIDKLILALVRGMGDLGASESDISRVIQWAMKLPPTNRALCMVLDHKLWLRTFGNDGISFVSPVRG